MKINVNNISYYSKVILLSYMCKDYALMCTSGEEERH